MMVVAAALLPVRRRNHFRMELAHSLLPNPVAEGNSDIVRHFPQSSGWLAFEALMSKARVNQFAIVAVSAFLFSSAALADNDCNVPHFHFVNDGVTPATMSVRRGTGCKFHFEMTNSVYGMAGILASTVTLRPKNGLLGKNTIRIYAYKPNDEFVGSDEFELKVRYNRDDGQGEHESLLHVAVTVY